MTYPPWRTWATKGNQASSPCRSRNPKGTKLTEQHKQLNWLQAHARARAEQANAVLKMTFKALRHVSLDPGTIGHIVAAALVLLHVEHGRTT